MRAIKHTRYAVGYDVASFVIYELWDGYKPNKFIKTRNYKKKDMNHLYMQPHRTVKTEP